MSLCQKILFWTYVVMTLSACESPSKSNTEDLSDQHETPSNQNHDSSVFAQNVKDTINVLNDTNRNIKKDNRNSAKFDTIEYVEIERKFNGCSDISFFNWFGRISDSVYHGVITKKGSLRIDSLIFLSGTTYWTEAPDTMCFYALHRFLEVGNEDVLSIQIFDRKYSCGPAPLGKQIVIADEFYRINRNGHFIRWDTVMYSYPYTLIGNRPFIEN